MRRKSWNQSLRCHFPATSLHFGPFRRLTVVMIHPWSSNRILPCSFLRRPDHRTRRRTHLFETRFRQETSLLFHVTRPKSSQRTNSLFYRAATLARLYRQRAYEQSLSQRLQLSISQQSQPTTRTASLEESVLRPTGRYVSFRCTQTFTISTKVYVRSGA